MKTYALVMVSAAAYDEIKTALVKAEYYHHVKPMRIEMDGLALVPRPDTAPSGLDTKRGKVVKALDKWLQETYGVAPNSQQLAAIDKLLIPLA